jgi:hypothetical protein
MPHSHPAHHECAKQERQKGTANYIMRNDRFKSVSITQTCFSGINRNELARVVPEPPKGRVLFNATDLFDSHEFRSPQ